MDTVETYNIKTEAFEGPFNLLLHLIEDRKLFINEISLAQVTDEYMRYVNEIAEVHPTHLASFISVASTLILIKSKSLLPGIELTNEEEDDIRRLEERLRLYELFSEISSEIKKNFGKQIIFPSEGHSSSEVMFVPDPKITVANLYELAQGLIQNAPKKTFLPQVEVKKVISIEEMIGRLTDRIQKSLKVSFSEFTGGTAKTKEEKVTMIVGFLAMLELTRQGLLNVIQEGNFEDITIEKIWKN